MTEGEIFSPNNKIITSDKRPPKEFYSELDSVVEHQVKSREAFDRAIDIAKSSGFTDFEIILFIKDYLKDKIPHTSLYRYINELTNKQFPLVQIDDNNVLLEHGQSVDIRISDVKIGKRIRNVDKFPDDGFESLVGSIAIDGLINPIIINKDKLLLSGYRRLKACEVLKWETIPARVMDITDNLKIVGHQLMENTWLNLTKEEVEEYCEKWGIAYSYPKGIRTET